LVYEHNTQVTLTNDLVIRQLYSRYISARSKPLISLHRPTMDLLWPHNVVKRAYAMMMSVCLSVCHTRESRLNDSGYRNMFCTA